MQGDPSVTITLLLQVSKQSFLAGLSRAAHYASFTSKTVLHMCGYVAMKIRYDGCGRQGKGNCEWERERERVGGIGGFRVLLNLSQARAGLG